MKNSSEIAIFDKIKKFFIVIINNRDMDIFMNKIVLFIFK